ncbi:MAG: hypothetical protein KGH71_04985 [Candidatus Micrarchaeota archaeon]|nr:hypothetical protein [Candidatus Micrarchaeota archaeon]
MQSIGQKVRPVSEKEIVSAHERSAYLTIESIYSILASSRNIALMSQRVKDAFEYETKLNIILTSKERNLRIVVLPPKHPDEITKKLIVALHFDYVMGPEPITKFLPVSNTKVKYIIDKESIERRDKKEEAAHKVTQELLEVEPRSDFVDQKGNIDAYAFVKFLSEKRAEPKE